MNEEDLYANLEQAFWIAFAQLESEFEDPYYVRDSNGRFIILDGLVELSKLKRQIEGYN